jgi:hypothetical protein
MPLVRLWSSVRQDHLRRLTIWLAEVRFASDPDVKSSGETTNLKIYFYGPDAAIATYNVHFIQTGHKDKKYNSDLELSCLDVWKKLNGEWKALAGSNTSTKPVPPEMYKMEMPPNFPSPTS